MTSNPFIFENFINYNLTHHRLFHIIWRGFVGLPASAGRSRGTLPYARRTWISDRYEDNEFYDYLEC
jgi:hypothetical protein